MTPLPEPVVVPTGRFCNACNPEGPGSRPRDGDLLHLCEACVELGSFLYNGQELVIDHILNLRALRAAKVTLKDFQPYRFA